MVSKSTFFLARNLYRHERKSLEECKKDWSETSSKIKIEKSAPVLQSGVSSAVSSRLYLLEFVEFHQIRISELLHQYIRHKFYIMENRQKILHVRTHRIRCQILKYLHSNKKK